jgi:hypothetical protein
MSTATITLPNVEVELTVDQLIMAARQLEYSERLRLAKALADTELDVEMAQLISELYSLPPVNEISDADILAEIHSVRSQHS